MKMGAAIGGVLLILEHGDLSISVSIIGLRIEE